MILSYELLALNKLLMSEMINKTRAAASEDSDDKVHTRAKLTPSAS